MELKNCPSETSQPIELWEIIHLCGFKSLSFGAFFNSAPDVELNSSSLTQLLVPWPGHESSLISLLPVRLKPVSLEIAAGWQVTVLPLAYTLHSGAVQRVCIFAWTQVGHCEASASLAVLTLTADCLLTWLMTHLSAWLSLAPHDVLSLAWLKAPGILFAVPPFHLLIWDSFSLRPVSCCYKWISNTQAWNPNCSSKNWQLFKPDLELPSGWILLPVQ